MTIDVSSHDYSELDSSILSILEDFDLKSESYEGGVSYTIENCDYFEFYDLIYKLTNVIECTVGITNTADYPETIFLTLA